MTPAHPPLINWTFPHISSILTWPISCINGLHSNYSLILSISIWYDLNSKKNLKGLNENLKLFGYQLREFDIFQKYFDEMGSNSHNNSQEYRSFNFDSNRMKFNTRPFSQRNTINYGRKSLFIIKSKIWPTTPTISLPLSFIEQLWIPQIILRKLL
jgi:hypothetical protein